jgi:hypothetical protein
MMTGHIRIDRTASPPWQYRGELTLPSGRYARIEASISEDTSGKFLVLRGGLEPGMSATELEAALAGIETTKAEIARHELYESDELPF